MISELSVKSEDGELLSEDLHIISLEKFLQGFPTLISESRISDFINISFIALNCSPSTPIDQLNSYAKTIRDLDSQLRDILNKTAPGSIHMTAFGEAGNRIVNYVNSLPSNFCIGPGNQSAFDDLNNSLVAANSAIDAGRSLFERNLDTFISIARPMLLSVLNEATQIDGSSRDFTSVLQAVRRWDSFIVPYNGKIAVWSLTPRMASVWNEFDSLHSRADAALGVAISQIETNVEFEASKFEDLQKTSEAALVYWDEVDGQEGYDRYLNARKEMRSSISSFNEFLRRVPATERVKTAVVRAQSSISVIDTGFKSFTNLDPLPLSDSSFPHKRYGPENRKFTGGLLRNALITIAQKYQQRTGSLIFIGDLNYQHGGKIKGTKHKSHKLGIDGDVDGTEIGDYPQNNKSLALALAKEILETGPALVFYADPEVVSEANKWADKNNMRGRLQVEPSHDKHFHLRMDF